MASAAVTATMAMTGTAAVAAGSAVAAIAAAEIAAAWTARLTGPRTGRTMGARRGMEGMVVDHRQGEADGALDVAQQGPLVRAQKDSATPSAPARAVRPMRWT